MYMKKNILYIKTHFDVLNSTDNDRNILHTKYNEVFSVCLTLTVFTSGDVT